jgi:hypothetical protein
MKKNIYLLLLTMLVFHQESVFAQGQPAPPTTPAPAVNTTTTTKPAEPAPVPVFGIKMSGFVRNDFFVDSRQTQGIREGSVSLWPKDLAKDASGADINAAPSFNMLGINSRLGGAITGPDAFGAKTSGLLEMEFFGSSEGDVGVVRLRHAWMKLDWTKTQLAFGQFWHPLFVPECFPGVANFNTGILFQPFNRSPQIRMTNKLSDKVSLILAAIAERDFVSSGPATTGNGSDYQRNGILPGLHAQLQYKTASVVAGAAIDFKTLRPRLSIGSGTTLKQVNETVSGVSLMGYLKVVGKSVTFKAEGLLGQNMTDQVMLGGYLAYGSATGETYKPTKTNSIWVELLSNSKTIAPAIFVGYTKNAGAEAGAIGAYGRAIGITGRGIDNLFRISPRIDFLAGKFKITPELEYTKAGWGTMGNDGKVTGAIDNTTNVRFLLLTQYSF